MKTVRLMLAVVVIAAGCFAQGRPAREIRPPRGNPDILERLERMTPEERRRFLERLPPGRRARIEQRLEAFGRLSPEQRERLRKQYLRFREMPPEEQESARTLFRKFRELPEERRRALRQEYTRLRRMPKEARSAELDPARSGERFSAEERRMLREMIELAPE